jgi:hypothetical protein
MVVDLSFHVPNNEVLKIRIPFKNDFEAGANLIFRQSKGSIFKTGM